MDKVVYAAMDVTLSIAVLYNYLSHWAEILNDDDILGEREVNWDNFMEAATKSLVDREMFAKKKKFRRSYEKCLVRHEAAMELSREVRCQYSKDWSDDTEKRRKQLSGSIRKYYDQH